MAVGSANIANMPFSWNGRTWRVGNMDFAYGDLDPTTEDQVTQTGKFLLMIKGQEYQDSGLQDAINAYLKPVNDLGYKPYTKFSWTLPHMGVQLNSETCTPSRPEFASTPLDRANNMVTIVFTCANLKENVIKFGE